MRMVRKVEKHFFIIIIFLFSYFYYYYNYCYYYFISLFFWHVPLNPLFLTFMGKRKIV